LGQAFTGWRRTAAVMTYTASIRFVATRPVVILAASLLAFAGTMCGAAQAEDAQISIRRAAERTSFSDDEIKDGFFKTALHPELQFSRAAERIRKFDEPVRVFVDNRAAPDRRADIVKVVADIRAKVRDLDVTVTEDRQSANFVVLLVERRDFARMIRARYGQDRAAKIQRALSPECLSGIAKDSSFRIRRSEAILPVDAGEFAFYDCAYEELLQGLGIINDDNSVPWTMFNDDVQMGFFDLYDQYLVNILYDPRVRAGMTKDDVEKLLPDVLANVRAWVTKANSRGAESVGTSSVR
jgi:Protein of unknown function (DUF2927)